MQREVVVYFNDFFIKRELHTSYIDYYMRIQWCKCVMHESYFYAYNRLEGIIKHAKEWQVRNE